jgi:catechol 2,3-dioxygenase-like lactoylglutathione lyase family enzyme
MSARLEHANLSVLDLDAMLRFVSTAFPEFRIRGETHLGDDDRCVHVGTDDAYLALVQATDARAPRRAPYAASPGTNHLGFEVDDVAALRARMLAAGYRETTVPNAHPFRRRVYFEDPEGNDWEFVQYFSADPRERNDYQLSS